MKSAPLTGNEPNKRNNYCSSYFLVSAHYAPRDPSLAKPSTAPTYTFYVYRSYNYGKDYPLGNVNVASLGGALWYLHNEIIPTCRGDGTTARKWGDRKFSAARMKRYKVTYKPTEPIKHIGMNFGPLKSFDFGEATGPHRGNLRFGKGTGPLSGQEWEQYGYVWGCGVLGQWPHQDWHSAKSYPNPVWYSLPGPCPTKDIGKWDAKCMIEQPGGWCEGTPTGQGNCTYTYEEAGEIDIDTLVGIKPKWRSRADFCSRCGREGGPYGSGGCGLRWWDNIWDPGKGKWRYDQTDKLFKKLYPHLPAEKELSDPKCDFDRHKYGI